VQDLAIHYTFQVTKLVELNIKRLLAKPVTIISEQTALPRMRICPCGWSHNCPENHTTSLQTHVVH